MKYNKYKNVAGNMSIIYMFKYINTYFTIGASGACRFWAKSAQLSVRSFLLGGNGGGAARYSTFAAVGTLTCGETGTVGLFASTVTSAEVNCGLLAIVNTFSFGLL